MPLLATNFILSFADGLTFCLDNFFSNRFLSVIHSSINFPLAFHTICLQVNKKLVVFCDTALSELMLYSCSFGMFSEKGFIVLSIIIIILAIYGEFSFIWLGSRSQVISSFFGIPSCSNNIWSNCCSQWMAFIANIELVIDETAVRWLAALKVIVCSSPRLIDPEAKHFLALLSEKHPLRNLS